MQRRRYKMGILRSHECSLISAWAEKIANSYLSNCEVYEKHRDQNFVKLKTTRIQVPPYLRPISVLKRDIYRFSVNVYRDGKVDFLRELCYVSKVQNAKHADRLRDPSIVDLAIRLIRWSSRPKERGRPYKPIFSNSIQKQMVTELNYAFAHRVDPLLCTAFITELGGHEIIGAMVSTQKSELQEGWLRAMQRGSRFRVSHEPTALYGTRKLRVMHTSEADALRHEEELVAKWEEEEAKREEEEAKRAEGGR